MDRGYRVGIAVATKVAVLIRDLLWSVFDHGDKTRTKEASMCYKHGNMASYAPSVSPRDPLSLALLLASHYWIAC